MHRRARMLLACAFFVTQSSTFARADDCKLGRIAALDFTDNGAVIVPVSLDGTKLPMAIDTGSGLSGIDPLAAKNIGVAEKRMYQGQLYDAEGEPFTYMATVHALGIGDMHAEDVKLLVWPSPMSSSGDLAGVLGANMLRHYDIDLDFGAHRLGLFSQDHCPGKVVYWTNGTVAVVPMHVAGSGQIVLPATLDGHALDAMLDTGATYSHLSMAFAHSLYGLSASSPDMEKVGTMSGAVETPIYRHTFKTLSLEGLTINNPAIDLEDNLVQYSATQTPTTGTHLSQLRASEGNTDFILGLKELHRLHVYIAYGEQKLYISPASAPVAVAADGAPAKSDSATSSAPAAAAH